MTELQDHLSVGRRDDILKKLDISELKKIKAGATFSASLINALVRGINSFLDVGRYFGSSIRRFIGGNSCPLK